MILLWLIVILLVGGILAWAADRWSEQLPRWISLAATGITLALGLVLWARAPAAIEGEWLAELNWSWIPEFGIRFHLAIDGLSLPLVILTSFLGMTAVLASWTEIRRRVGFFHFNLMWVLAGIVAVFLAMDLFLFYFAWELMLIPMYFLIAIWGHERRVYAAVKFFLFTQLSGLLMLAAVIALAFLHYQSAGSFSFSYEDLLGQTMPPATAQWLMLGFFAAFAVKLPMVPVHTWLPDAHTEAPTAGSVVLAGLLLKTGAYGLLRFVIPLFPDASRELAPVILLLAVVGILYGALLAFAQTDFKRMVAYTSVSHLGFVLLGVFAFNEFAAQGALMQMICHGLSTGALFIIAGALQERMHTRDLNRMGGLWTVMPRLSGVALFFAMASLGLPGLGNFVAEFLVLVGAYAVNIPLAVAGTVGVVAATIYSLHLVQKGFHGPAAGGLSLPDLSRREAAVFAPMILLLVALGLYPQPVFDVFRPSLRSIEKYAEPAKLVFWRPHERN